ncbi:MAG: helix-turn-helix transcriptional regulator [Spirochaetaceae bacterium]|nr:helix-turn-helix transcriptional regulator [Spirochaetaceae bacterium]
MKENRRKQGITQEQFAEKADVSTHYVAMIETCKAFPTADMLERLAKTLNIAPYQLFSVDAAPNEVFEQMRQVIIADIKQLMPDMEQVMMGIKQGVKEAVKETLAEDSNGKSC